MPRSALALLLLVAPVAAPLAAQPLFPEAPPMADDALGAIAGREGTALLAQSTQAGTVADNSVGDNVTTGAVQIDGQAFQNLQGLSLLNVNTGNNVAMNTSMNVTIAINPGP